MIRSAGGWPVGIDGGGPDRNKTMLCRFGDFNGRLKSIIKIVRLIVKERADHQLDDSTGLTDPQWGRD